MNEIVIYPEPAEGRGGAELDFETKTLLIGAYHRSFL